MILACELTYSFLDFLSAFTAFADNLFFYILNALTLVRFRLFERADFGSHLAYLLLINTANSNNVLFDANCYANRYFIQHLMRKSKIKFQIRTGLGCSVTNSVNF